MNEQKKDSASSIEWTRVYGRKGYTWNPIAGCKHACSWTMPDGVVANCYAEDVAENGMAKHAYPHGFEHHYWKPQLLDEPLKVREPAGIFVGSMADVFGTWVAEEQIRQVLDVARQAPQHTFIFLTKNAPRLLKFEYPSNCWIGASMPPDFMFGKPMDRYRQIRMLTRTMDVLKALRTRGTTTWLSAEPLSWHISSWLIPAALDWCVIGAASTGRKYHAPRATVFTATVKQLDKLGVPVFYKGNLRVLPEAVNDWREGFPQQRQAPKPIEAINLVQGTLL